MLLKLICMFKNLQETIFGCSYGERLAFTPEAARSVMHVRQQAVLILIEALDLENLLLMVHDETSFRSASLHGQQVYNFDSFG